MTDSKVTRRSFVQTGMISLLAVRAGLSGEFRGDVYQPKELEASLEARVMNPAVERVSFGLPLPPGLLSDARRVRIVNNAGEEIAAAVRQLEPWRIGGDDGTIRSLLIQFSLDFSRQRTQKVKILFQ